MEIKIFVPCLFLLVLVSGQTGVHKSYDWRTTGRIQEWPKLTSLIPFGQKVVTETYPVVGDLPSRYSDDSRAYPENSYSGEYHGPSPYQYADIDQSLSSYEQYDNSPRQQINMTMERIGGFAGSGDTRGYGAYDFPRKNHQQELHHERRPKLQTELTDLLRISRNHHTGFHNSDPMFVHPMPPPL